MIQQFSLKVEICIPDWLKYLLECTPISVLLFHYYTIVPLLWLQITQNMPCYYTVEQDKNADGKWSKEKAAMNGPNTVLFHLSCLTFKATNFFVDQIFLVSPIKTLLWLHLCCFSSSARSLYDWYDAKIRSQNVFWKLEAKILNNEIIVEWEIPCSMV